MTREDMEEVLRIVEKETVKARSLGGYSTEATTIMVMWEVILKLVRHECDKLPRRKRVE